ncbi:MAG: hypothetical protein GX653_02975 [Clostridiales bacterium]|nr:hypothetical protein [Clostridiales bacterium]
MKRLACVALSMLLLCLVSAVAEEGWSTWQELSSGLWQRESLALDEGGTVMVQRAKGDSVKELVPTENMVKGYGETGKLAWTNTYYLDDEEKILSQANYNYDEKGILAHGAVTIMDEDGVPEIILVLSVTSNQDGSFTTQVEMFDRQDVLLSRTHTVYDRDGNFISGTVFNLETKENDEATQPPAQDPIQEEWLKKLT